MRKKQQQLTLRAVAKAETGQFQRLEDLLVRSTGKDYVSFLQQQGRVSFLSVVREKIASALELTSSDAWLSTTESEAPLREDATDAEKIARNRERNRIHARRSRMKKKIMLEGLKDETEACRKDTLFLIKVSEPEPNLPCAPHDQVACRF
jgi:hypothetical protein